MLLVQNPNLLLAEFGVDNLMLCVMCRVTQAGDAEDMEGAIASLLPREKADASHGRWTRRSPDHKTVLRHSLKNFSIGEA